MNHAPLRGLRAPTLCLALTTLTACASGSASGPSIVEGLRLPTTTTFDGGPRPIGYQASAVRDTLVDGERGRIWAVLPSVFESLGVDAQMIDPVSFVIGTQGLRTSRLEGALLSQYLDCGGGVAGPNAESYDVTLSLFVQLEAEQADSTRVRTVVDALARSRYNLGQELQCSSFGTLERRVVALVDEWLVAPPGSPPGRARGPSRAAVAGDFVRLECTYGAPGVVAAGEGALLGIGEGALVLDLGPTAPSVEVPVASVTRLEIRERRSRGRVGALLGGGVGLGVGAVLGRAAYDPNSDTHYQPGVTTTVGAVVGLATGALLGRIVGSFVEYDAWVDGEVDLYAEPIEGGSAPPSGGASRACPSLLTAP